MKLKIVSDGTKVGTRVVNAETQEVIEDIRSIAWSIDTKNGHPAECVIRLYGSLVEAEQEVDELACPACGGELLEGIWNGLDLPHERPSGATFLTIVTGS